MSAAGPGGFILGTFLLLFGICILFVGGGCTLMWIYILAFEPKGMMLALPMLLLSGAIAWVGFLMLRAATRMFRSE